MGSSRLEFRATILSVWPCLLQVYNYSVPTFGKGVVFDVDLKTRVEQFRFFTEALKVERLKSYVPQFVSEAEVRTAGIQLVCGRLCTYMALGLVNAKPSKHRCCVDYAHMHLRGSDGLILPERLCWRQCGPCVRDACGRFKDSTCKQAGSAQHACNK